MFKYLKQYDMADMRQMFRNNKTPHLRSEQRLDGKTVVIAGATSGVGLAAAQEMVKHGATLVLVARSKEKVSRVAEELHDATGTTVRCYLADFADLTAVNAVAAQISEEEPVVDVLINSAGMHSTRRIETAAGHELVFCVNHLAPFILTLRLIPAMRRSTEARIIQVNSQGHRFGGLDPDDLDWHRRHYTGLRGYGASKTAQLLTVWEFADRLIGTSVTINAMHPGEVRSAIGENNGRLYNWYKSAILARSLKDPAISGESLHYLAAAPEVRGVSGVYFNLTHPEKPAPHALDREVGRIIWQRTLELTGLHDEL